MYENLNLILYYSIIYLWTCKLFIGLPKRFACRRGEEIFLKYIVMAFSVYEMSCFRLSKHHCQQLASAMSRLWWNDCEKKNKIHWIAWIEVCRSKVHDGIRFWDIGEFNHPLLAKEGWKILNEPDSLLSNYTRVAILHQMGSWSRGKVIGHRMQGRA